MKSTTLLPLALLLFLVPSCNQEAAETSAEEPPVAAAADDAPAEGGAEETSAGMDMDQAAPDCFATGDLEGRPSPLASASASFGDVMVQVCYGAPSRRDREIMGGLVPYDTPWRMGANEATAIYLSGPASVGGVALDAAAYSLYAVPSMDEWTIHINSVNERWGIPINEGVMENDVGSFTVAPDMLDEAVETLRYTFEDVEGGVDLVMEWEQTGVRIPLRSS